MINNSWIALRHLSMNGINLVNLKLNTREAKQEIQLSSKLVKIDASIEQIKLLLEEICPMSSKKTLSTYEISQSYLKKANLITEIIAALGALKKNDYKSRFSNIVETKT